VSNAEDDIMQEPLVRFPITCPECAMEQLAERPLRQIAEALAVGSKLRLYSACHDVYWTATFIEREQLRDYLKTLGLGPGLRADAHPQSPGAFQAVDHQAT
jgi:hypothetical protein